MTPLLRWFARDLDVDADELAVATARALIAAPFVLVGAWAALALLFAVGG